MELATDITEPIDQGTLDVHMDIFQLASKREASPLNLLANLTQRRFDLVLLTVRQ